MKSDLDAALRKQYGDSPTPIMAQHLEFALTTRERGRKTLDEVESRLGIELEGKRLLDVGSAYAGFVIEAAKRGASAWGVEISGKLWRLGKLNARGEEGDINLVPGNFLAPQVARVLPDDCDIVILSDVFEHIYDTAGLLAQLARLMVDGATFVFSIPNGHALRYVEREPHYGVAGLTLLPANWWNAVVPSFTAFYRPWSFYTGLFRAFGFEVERWNGKPQVSLEKAREVILSGLSKVEDAVARVEVRDPKVRPALAGGLADYRAELLGDLEQGDLELLHWKYLVGMWRGSAVKRGPVLADVDDRHSPVRRRERRPVRLDGDPSELVSKWTKRAECRIQHQGGSLRCDVIGSDDSSMGQYGGVVVDVDAPFELTIDLELINPESVKAVYIDGEDARSCRVLRWRWLVESGAEPRHRLTLVPNRASPPFTAVPESCFPELVANVHVFICVKPGHRAGFIIHQLLAE